MNIPANPALLGPVSLAARRRLSDHGPVGTSDPKDDREAMLRDGGLRKALGKVLRGRVEDADVEDLVEKTLFAAYQARKLPDDPAERRQYILAIARKKAVSHHRAQVRRPQVDAEAVVENIAEAVAVESVSDRQLLTKLVATLPDEQLPTFRCLARHLLGENLADIARELRVDYDVLYKRVTTLHRRVRATATVLGGLGALVLVLAGAWYVLQPRPREVRQPPATPPTSAPAVSSQAPDLAALEEARRLRAQAFNECAANQWGTCFDDLEEAKKTDPAGDDDPLVQAARKDIEKYSEAKPGPLPPRVRPYAPNGPQ